MTKEQTKNLGNLRKDFSNTLNKMSKTGKNRTYDEDDEMDDGMPVAPPKPDRPLINKRPAGSSNGDGQPRGPVTKTPVGAVPKSQAPSNKTKSGSPPMKRNAVPDDDEEEESEEEEDSEDSDTSESDSSSEDEESGEEDGDEEMLDGNAQRPDAFQILHATMESTLNENDNQGDDSDGQQEGEEDEEGWRSKKSKSSKGRRGQSANKRAQGGHNNTIFYSTGYTDLLYNQRWSLNTLKTAIKYLDRKLPSIIVDPSTPESRPFVVLRRAIIAALVSPRYRNTTSCRMLGAWLVQNPCLSQRKNSQPNISCAMCYDNTPFFAGRSSGAREVESEELFQLAFENPVNQEGKKKGVILCREHATDIICLHGLIHFNGLRKAYLSDPKKNRHIVSALNQSVKRLCTRGKTVMLDQLCWELDLSKARCNDGMLADLDQNVMSALHETGSVMQKCLIRTEDWVEPTSLEGLIGNSEWWSENLEIKIQPPKSSANGGGDDDSDEGGGDDEDEDANVNKRQKRKQQPSGGGRTKQQANAKKAQRRSDDSDEDGENEDGDENTAFEDDDGALKDFGLDEVDEDEEEDEEDEDEEMEDEEMAAEIEQPLPPPPSAVVVAKKQAPQPLKSVKVAQQPSKPIVANKKPSVAPTQKKPAAVVDDLW